MQVGNPPAHVSVEASRSNNIVGAAKAKLRNYTLIKLYAKNVENPWATKWPAGRRHRGYFYQNLMKFLILSRPFSPAAAPAIYVQAGRTPGPNRPTSCRFWKFMLILGPGARRLLQSCRDILLSNRSRESEAKKCKISWNRLRPEETGLISISPGSRVSRCRHRRRESVVNCDSREVVVFFAGRLSKLVLFLTFFDFRDLRKLITSPFTGNQTRYLGLEAGTDAR